MWLHWDSVHGETMSQPLLPASVWPFSHPVWSCSATFSEETVPSVAADLVCPWEKAIQDLPPLPSWTALLRLFLTHIVHHLFLLGFI